MTRRRANKRCNSAYVAQYLACCGTEWGHIQDQGEVNMAVHFSEVHPRLKRRTAVCQGFKVFRQ